MYKLFLLKKLFFYVLLKIHKIISFHFFIKKKAVNLFITLQKRIFTKNTKLKHKLINEIT